MEILFLTRFNPRDIHEWSGIFYNMCQKLKEKNHVEIMGAEILGQIALYSRRNFPNGFFLPEYRYEKKLGRLLSERINGTSCELILFGDLLLQPLDIHVPFLHCSDLTYELVKIHYAKSDERSIETFIELEKLALSSAYRIIYCTEWLKNRVAEIYDIDPNKIDVVEFGANIPAPTKYSIDIQMDICRLVFIGVDWERKGGDIVLQTYQPLKNEGFPCTLTIIGSTPKYTPEYDPDLTIIPFLDKNREDHLQKLNDILYESHFLVLPTQFDAFGIVFCEASAYGIPSIATNVGGVGQPVREGKNGFLLPPDATAQDYAEKIKTVFSDRESYIKLRASSRHEYETRLNWDVWGERVNAIFEDAVKEWKSR